MTRTLDILRAGIPSVPADVAWQLAEIGQCIGRQELYSAQAPQVLKSLRDHAMVESAISSNRIEGIEVEQRRIGTLIWGNASVTNRDEEEVRGYRRALEWIHRDAASIDCGEETIRKLHALARGNIWDAGQYKERDGDIIERYPDGETRVRFRTVGAAETPRCMAAMSALWTQFNEERWAHPLVGIAAFNLDFLCIHPFRDGNGRVSRLLLLLQAYQAQMEVGRYISLERIIEAEKQRYYDTLAASSKRWHEGKHDFWPWVRFLLFILKDAYREFELRLSLTGPRRGEKTTSLMRFIAQQPGTFSVSDIRRGCPAVSVDLIRRVLKNLQAQGAVECLGRGPAAVWKNRRKSL